MDLASRLNKIAQNDKKNNPKYLTQVIKSDFFYLINNYFEVAFEDINLEIDLKGKQYSININCLGDRIKNFRALPD